MLNIEFAKILQTGCLLKGEYKLAIQYRYFKSGEPIEDEFVDQLNVLLAQSNPDQLTTRAQIEQCSKYNHLYMAFENFTVIGFARMSIQVGITYSRVRIEEVNVLERLDDKIIMTELVKRLIDDAQVWGYREVYIPEEYSEHALIQQISIFKISHIKDNWVRIRYR